MIKFSDGSELSDLEVERAKSYALSLSEQMEEGRYMMTTMGNGEQTPVLMLTPEEVVIYTFAVMSAEKGEVERGD